MDAPLQFARRLVEPLRVAPGRTIELHREFDPGYTGGLTSDTEAADHLQAGLALLVDYQDKLSAQGTVGVLLVIQGIDAAGKDGTIKHVMSGVNPQGVEIHNFKEPSAEELRHDFLWRHQRALPGRGTIGIFNRSHYEEVLVVRVHADRLVADRLPEATQTGDIWMRRYREINDWEHHVAENGIRVVKVFLNLSKGEQASRFLRRIDHPAKNWKFSVGDIAERRHWDDYQRAFDQMLSHTSTEWAPWYVIPADHKWFARLATAAVLIRALSEIDPRYPTPPPQALQEMAAARADLVAEITD